MSTLISTTPVPRWQIAFLFVLLPIRMLRASFILAYRAWLIRPNIGDKFDLSYRILCGFDGKKWPRVVDSETTG